MGQREEKANVRTEGEREGKPVGAWTALLTYGLAATNRAYRMTGACGGKIAWRALVETGEVRAAKDSEKTARCRQEEISK
jgi:hypothetical protein